MNKKELIVLLKILGQPLKVYAVIYDSDDSDTSLMAICMTRRIAQRRVKELMKEYYWRRQDLKIEEWELII